ncbi:MAG: hypothetical protein HOO93_07390 [Methyloglobulus sp.]|nr:hypothetical protein [Methyloglobulus sp.]
MQPLKLSQAPNSVTALKDRYSGEDNGLIDLFPKPRYFQVHFQHIHEHNQQLQDELMQLKETVAHLDEKFGRLLTQLNSPPDAVR